MDDSGRTTGADGGGVTLRRPIEQDHPSIVAAIADWWDTPNASQLALLMPRLFLQHFTGTSLIAEHAPSRELAGFLIGFRSPDHPEVAYIHFVGVSPRARGLGLGRTLYERFFDDQRAAGCREVRCITGPPNRASQAFHRAMGFETAGEAEVDGVLAYRDYDGPGEHRVAFRRAI